MRPLEVPGGGPDVPSFPLRAVAALFLARQHLDLPRGRPFTEENVVRLASDTGGLQIDSINVLDRAHYLTAWSRFGPYDRRALDELVYGRRVLFEYWAHAACLVATAHFPYWRRAMLDYSPRSRAWGSWLKKNKKVIQAIEKGIAAGGPMGSADFEGQGRRRPGGWWNWKPSTHALDYLWMSGRTLIQSRVNFHKRFDLAERVMADALATAPASAEEFGRWHLRQSLHAMGAATMADLRMYLSFPRGGALPRRRLLDELLQSGEVTRVSIEGGGKQAWYARVDDLPNLAAAAEECAPSRGTAMLTPFDSLLWHRERVDLLFGFVYRIEVYTPGHKRVHGYYVLPVFHDGQLIGRLDAKAHRQSGRLEAKRLHFEPWFARGQAPPAVTWGKIDRDQALAGVADALGSLATFVGAERITLGRVLPARLATPLKRALKAVAPASTARPTAR